MGDGMIAARLVAPVMLTAALAFSPSASSTAVGASEVDRTVTRVYVARDGAWPVRWAMRQWNRVDAGQSLLRVTRDRARADVVVNVKRSRGPRVDGVLLWGYVDQRRGHTRMRLWEGSARRFDQRAARRRHIATHEFGHVLGLEHRDTCRSVMSYCLPKHRAGIPRPVDRQTVRRINGGAR